MPEIETLQPFAIAAAAFSGMVLGALWYSPVLFGNAWMKALGKTAEDLGSPAHAMAGSVLACVVSACAVEWLVLATGAQSLPAGLGTGALLGFGILAMGMLSDSLFSGWGWRLYFIQAGYRVTYLLAMGAICGAWPR